MLPKIIINHNNTLKGGSANFPTELLVDVSKSIKTLGNKEWGVYSEERQKQWAEYCINVLTSSRFFHSFVGSVFRKRKEKMDTFLGRWKLVSSTNFDKYLEEFGLSEIDRNILLSIDQSKEIFLEFMRNGDEWSMKTTWRIFGGTKEITHLNECPLGVQREQTTYFGRRAMITYEYVNGKFKEHLEGTNDEAVKKRSHVERSVEGNRLIEAYTFGTKAWARRIFSRSE